MHRRLFLATVVLAGLTALTAVAQTVPSTRVRGIIVSVEGNVLTVNSPRFLLANTMNPLKYLDSCPESDGNVAM